jgi:hypothetical protein
LTSLGNKRQMKKREKYIFTLIIITERIAKIAKIAKTIQYKSVRKKITAANKEYEMLFEKIMQIESGT